MPRVAGIMPTPNKFVMSYRHDNLQSQRIMVPEPNLMNNSHLCVVVQGLRRVTREKMELFNLKETGLIIFLVLLVFSSVKQIVE